MDVLAGAVAARLDGDDAEVEARRVGRARQELDVPDAVSVSGPDDDRSLRLPLAHAGRLSTVRQDSVE
jgi:hypothetical protein